MSNEKQRFLYAVLKDNTGRWSVVTSTEPLNSKCVCLTPVHGYPVEVRYMEIQSYMDKGQEHTVVCKDSCELGGLLNEMGKCPETHILLKIWDFDARDPQQAEASQHFWRHLAVTKLFAVKTEKGRWKCVCSPFPKAPVGYTVNEALFITAVDRFPVSLIYSTSDANGSSNWRETKAICGDALERKVYEMLFIESDHLLLHTIGHFDFDSPYGHHILNVLEMNGEQEAAPADVTETQCVPTDNDSLSFETLFNKRNEEIANLSEKLALALIQSSTVSGDNEVVIPVNLKYEIAAAVECILAEKGMYYCFPQYVHGRVPCFQTDICGNPNCPFKKSIAKIEDN